MGLFDKKTEGKNSGNSFDLVNTFITKSEGLRRILQKETQYYKDLKMKQAGMLIETKISLIDEIESLKASLTQDPTYIKTLDNNIQEKLKLANSELIQAAEDNYDETLKAKEVNRLILEAIADAVNSQSQESEAYSGYSTSASDGSYGSTQKSSHSSSPIAVSENV